jgi:hypothetical protein
MRMLEGCVSAVGTYQGLHVASTNAVAVWHMMDWACDFETCASARGQCRVVQQALQQQSKPEKETWPQPEQYVLLTPMSKADLAKVRR